MKRILLASVTIALFLLHSNAFASKSLIVYELGQFLTHQDDHINAPDDETMLKAEAGAKEALDSLKKLLDANPDAMPLLNNIEGVNNTIMKESALNNDRVAAAMTEGEMAVAVGKLKRLLEFPEIDKARSVDAVRKLLRYQNEHIAAPDDKTMNRAIRNIRTTKGILFVEVLGTPASRTLREYTNVNWEIMQLSAVNDDEKASLIANTDSKLIADRLVSLINSM